MESCPTELGVLTLPQCSSPEQPLVLRGVRRVRCCSFIAQRAGPGPEAGLTPRPGHRPLLCASSQLTQPSPSLAGGLGLFTAYLWLGATGPTSWAVAVLLCPRGQHLFAVSVHLASCWEGCPPAVGGDGRSPGSTQEGVSLPPGPKGCALPSQLTSPRLIRATLGRDGHLQITCQVLVQPPPLPLLCFPGAPPNKPFPWGSSSRDRLPGTPA